LEGKKKGGFKVRGMEITLLSGESQKVNQERGKRD